jgi:hypothetical protein
LKSCFLRGESFTERSALTTEVATNFLYLRDFARHVLHQPVVVAPNDESLLVFRQFSEQRKIVAFASESSPPVAPGPLARLSSVVARAGNPQAPALESSRRDQLHEPDFFARMSQPSSMIAWDHAASHGIT